MKTFQYDAGVFIVLIFLTVGCTKPSSQFLYLPSESMSRFDQDLFSRAIAHQRKGQIEPAIVLWKKFLHKYPNSYEARNNLGLLYYANDEIIRAIYQLEQGLKLEPGSVQIKNNLLRALRVEITILEENKEYDVAIINLRRVAQLSPAKEHEKVERQIEVLEDKIFEQVKKSNLMEEYQEFLKKYPRSPKNSDEARLWIEKWQQTEKIKQMEQLSDNLQSNLVIEPRQTINGFTVPESNSSPGTAPAGPNGESTFPTSPKMKMVEVIKSDGINVHSEPKIQAKNIVHKLKAGNQMIYTDENEAWYKVEFSKGRNGWIIKKYVKLVK